MPILGAIFEGWNGYETSARHAIEPLSSEQLLWRPAPRVRSLGEVIRHLSLVRITWPSRMNAPGIEEICNHVPRWYTDSDGVRHVVEDSVRSDESAVLSENSRAQKLRYPRVHIQSSRPLKRAVGK